MARQLLSQSGTASPQALMGPPLARTAEALSDLASWFGVALAHAMGRAAGPEPVAPPLLVFQPYRDIPRRHRR